MFTKSLDAGRFHLFLAISFLLLACSKVSGGLELHHELISYRLHGTEAYANIIHVYITNTDDDSQTVALGDYEEVEITRRRRVVISVEGQTDLDGKELVSPLVDLRPVTLRPDETALLVTLFATYQNHESRRLDLEIVYRIDEAVAQRYDLFSETISHSISVEEFADAKDSILPDE